MHWRLGYRRYLNLDQTKLANRPDKGKKDDRGRIYSSKIYNFRGCRNIAAFQGFSRQSQRKENSFKDGKCRQFFVNGTCRLPKKYLLIIAKMVDSSHNGLPIARQPALPTLSVVKFYTDAAGVSFSLHKGKRFCHDNSGRGVSCM